MKSCGDGELQRVAVAAKSGGSGGESERDGGAFNISVVTVLAAVLDRDVRACACSSEVTGEFLGLDHDR